MSAAVTTDPIKMSKEVAAKALEAVEKKNNERSLATQGTESADSFGKGVNVQTYTPRPYSYTRALYGVNYDKWDAKSPERRMHDVLCERSNVNPDELIREGRLLVPHSVSDGLDVSRAFNTFDANEAGALIRQGVGEVIDLLQSRLVLTEAGVQQITIPGAGFYWPREKQDITAFWVDEEGAIPTSEMKFGRIELRPKKLGALVHVPKEALADTTPSIDNFIRRSFGRKFARAEEKAFFFGKGTSATPRGLINDVDIEEVSTSFGSPTFEGLQNSLMKELELSEGNPGNATFITFVAAKYSLMALREGALNAADAVVQTVGQFLWAPNATGGVTPLFRGSPFLVTTNIDGTSANGEDVIFYGEWDETVIARTEAMEISVSTDFKFANDQVSFKATERVDMGALQPTLVKYVSGVTA